MTLSRNLEKFRMTEEIMGAEIDEIGERQCKSYKSC